MHTTDEQPNLSFPQLPSSQSPAVAPNRLTIKLRVPSPIQRFHHQQQLQEQMAHSRQPPLTRRRSTRLTNGTASRSGSEFSFREQHDDDEDDDDGEEQYAYSLRGRRRTVKTYKEVSEDDGFDDFDDDDQPIRRLSGRRARRNLPDFIASDDDDPAAARVYNTRSSRRSTHGNPHSSKPPAGRITRNSNRPPPSPRRITRRSAREIQEDDGYVEEEPDAEGEVDASFENEEEVPHTSPSPDPEPEDDAEGEPRTYQLRKRTKEINYTIPPPLEEIKSGRGTKGTKKRGGNSGHSGLRWGAGGAELSRAMGMGLPGDSDSDVPTRTPRKLIPSGAGGGLFAPGAGLMPPDLAGTPSNMGKVGDAALADADPLGVNTNVTFDEVGGLDDHINSLKEMTLLPLLYPELFQQFNVTPPRGVLFHGPPGTGKTLVARALAASCRSGGKNISFFMRKGADCLSKWVGEAERQLRLLFEEAKHCQPSIIFFDEIDGLAPVRSSKQDQIHASIVSTLLALMDGMDGRGQVIVIGATNRPDAIDPALRRPGRFDREFYFPLPNLEARTRILSIMTKGWEGWDGDAGDAARSNLAKITKGFGGADLRALCTEAALNAVQRRYPQIYRSNERLLVDPATVQVQARDFMISVRKLVPSSARSVATTASPLPPQLVPLLEQSLGSVKDKLAKVLGSAGVAGSCGVKIKKRTALEEAEWEEEDNGGEAGALKREMLLQAMETLRIHRPRIVIHGPPGMGQGYIGAAALHYLEGYHVQSLDLGSLMGDSTRTAEAAIVQLFIEAKRNKPSVVYIPSLTGWSAAVSETSRSTVRAMLDSLAPTDPILLLAVVEGSFSALPRDVRSWFGIARDNRIELTIPDSSRRSEFFRELVEYVGKKPSEFPDATKRKRRVLEVLPVAPPLPPRKPTEAELKLQADSDMRIKALLKYRLGPILTELKKKYKRFTKPAAEEYGIDEETGELGDFRRYRRPPTQVNTQSDVAVEKAHVNEIVQAVELPHTPPPAPNGIHVEGVIPEADGEPIRQVNGIQDASNFPPMSNSPDPLAGDPISATLIPSTPSPPPTSTQAVSVAVPPPQPPVPPKLHDIDLEKMHANLYYESYLTPNEFLDDIARMVYNAEQMFHDTERLFRAQAMFNAAQVSILEFDPHFRVECERMAVRERERLKEARKEKEKEDSGGNPGMDANGNGYAPGTRRSARHNGQKPELTCTDPLKLERKLKRQRSEGAADSSQQGEGGSGGEGDMIAGRSPKRARIELEDDPFALQPKNTVRFASPSLSNGASTYHMDVDEPRCPSPSSRLSSIPPNSGYHSISELRHPPVQPLEPTVSLSIPTQPHPSRADDISVSSLPQSLIALLNVPERQPSVPPRRSRSPSPIPPPPPFHISPELLAMLETFLIHDTSPLNVEQLEQLRATCLDTVWQRRADWDRDALVRELLNIVREFVEEVGLDQQEGESPVGGDWLDR